MRAEQTVRVIRKGATRVRTCVGTEEAGACSSEWHGTNAYTYLLLQCQIVFVSHGKTTLPIANEERRKFVGITRAG